MQLPASTVHLLIVSRDTLLQSLESERSKKIFRVLANISRKGIHLLLTSAEPDHWFPTRGSVDNALADQGKLQKMISDAGGDLEGVYYVPKSIFTRDRKREAALRDILRRYSLKPEEALLISASSPFLKAANRLQIKTQAIPGGSSGAETLENTLELISKA